MDMIKIGAIGGRGGSIWEEKADELVGIIVSYDEDVVYSLQFLNYVNGELHMSGNHQFFGGFHGTENSKGFIGSIVKDVPSSVIKIKDSQVKVKEEK
nr:uncharacterized protein LOC101257601 [Solanum lycopersicum]